MRNEHGVGTEKQIPQWQTGTESPLPKGLQSKGVSRASNRSTPKGTQRTGQNKMPVKSVATPPTRKSTWQKNEKNTGLIGHVETLKARIPVLFENLNLNSCEGKSQPLSLLDDTLLSLSLVLDGLRKKQSAESDIYEPETVKMVCEVAKEIRSLTQLKFDVARELAKLEFSKIKMAMEIENHARRLLGGS